MVSNMIEMYDRNNSFFNDKSRYKLKKKQGLIEINNIRSRIKHSNLY